VGGLGVKLSISAELCRGHGRCYTVAPDLLEDDDDEGFVTVRGQIIDVPDDQEDAARNAAGSCPERAITLIE
jgi:ferredoxin